MAAAHHRVEKRYGGSVARAACGQLLDAAAASWQRPGRYCGRSRVAEAGGGGVRRRASAPLSANDRLQQRRGERAGVFGVDPVATIAKLRARRPLLLKMIKSLYDEHDDRRLGRKVARDMAFGTMTGWR